MMERKTENTGAPKGPDTPATEQRCRILLVEDDLDDQVFSKRQLSASPLVEDVKCFSNGQELLEYMKSQGFQDHSVMCMVPTIIIIDLNMPKMDGFKILENLKSDPFLEEIPIIVVSSILSYETVRRALDLRADGIFRKPISVEKIQSFFKRAWQWPTQDMWMF